MKKIYDANIKMDTCLKKRNIYPLPIVIVVLTTLPAHSDSFYMLHVHQLHLFTKRVPSYVCVGRMSDLLERSIDKCKHQAVCMRM